MVLPGNTDKCPDLFFIIVKNLSFSAASVVNNFQNRKPETGNRKPETGEKFLVPKACPPWWVALGNALSPRLRF
jgi:hypothetical protein